jgi:hypothetical protein
MHVHQRRQHGRQMRGTVSGLGRLDTDYMPALDPVGPGRLGAEDSHVR